MEISPVVVLFAILFMTSLVNLYLSTDKWERHFFDAMATVELALTLKMLGAW